MRVQAFGPFSMSSFVNDEDEKKPRIYHDAQIVALREFYEAYKAPITFQVGDLVTPKINSTWTGHGDPRLVLNIRKDAWFDFSVGDPDTPNHGVRKDMRIAQVLRDGSIASMWVESVGFEPYVGETDGAKGADQQDT